jgi:metallo-beta-lactamase class B
MMNMNRVVNQCIACLLMLLFSVAVYAVEPYKSDNLEIYALTANTYVHQSYLQTEQWGKVSCNGLIYINKGEAVVFDTPPTDSVSFELIHWIQTKAHAKIVAIVVNHWHGDCLGGLGVFHRNGIASYSSIYTQTLAQKDSVNHTVVPQHGFSDSLMLVIGNKYVTNYFFGEGHTSDNIVSYIPSEKVLFGGCIIKALGASKGNLSEANVKAWPITVAKIKTALPAIQIVVPGHGKPGDASLLDYTIQLFQDKK